MTDDDRHTVQLTINQETDERLIREYGTMLDRAERVRAALNDGLDFRASQLTVDDLQAAFRAALDERPLEVLVSDE